VTLLATNRFLLERSGGNGGDYPGSIIIQPVSIDPTALIERSVVGPYVSMAAGSRVKESIINDSILNANSTVERSLLSESLVGEGASVKGSYRRLNVGDSSEIEIVG
jgi:glucose-1-phosphate thymidylyltransferase